MLCEPCFPICQGGVAGDAYSASLRGCSGDLYRFAFTDVEVAACRDGCKRVVCLKCGWRIGEQAEKIWQKAVLAHNELKPRLRGFRRIVYGVKRQSGHRNLL